MENNELAYKIINDLVQIIKNNVQTIEQLQKENATLRTLQSLPTIPIYPTYPTYPTTPVNPPTWAPPIITCETTTTTDSKDVRISDFKYSGTSIAHEE